MLALGHAVSIESKLNAYGEEERVPIGGACKEDRMDIGGGKDIPLLLDNVARGTTTTCPPPELSMKDNKEGWTTPSMVNDMKTIVCDVGSEDMKDEYGSSPGQRGVQVDDDSILVGDDGGGNDNVCGIQDIPVCVFSQGWCKTHKIKGG